MSAASSAAPFQVCKRVWNTLFHQCLAVAAIYVIWVPIEHYHNPFSWHVILCTLGLIPFMAEALILFSNDNVWSQDILRKYKYWIHGILISFGSFLLIMGIVLEIGRKEVAKVNYPEVTHFTSAHAVTGLICMIFAIFALACGPLAFTSAKLNRYAPPVWFKFLHNIVGQTGYVVGIVSLCLGYYTQYFESRTSLEARILVTVTTLTMAAWSLVVAWKSLYHQYKSVVH